MIWLLVKAWLMMMYAPQAQPVIEIRSLLRQTRIREQMGEDVAAY